MKHELTMNLKKVISVVTLSAFVAAAGVTDVCFAQSAGNGGPTNGQTGWGGNSGNPPDNPIGKFHPSTPQRPPSGGGGSGTGAGNGGNRGGGNGSGTGSGGGSKTPAQKDPKKGSEPAK